MDNVAAKGSAFEGIEGNVDASVFEDASVAVGEGATRVLHHAVLVEVVGVVVPFRTVDAAPDDRPCLALLH
eukprot:6821564-Lingulodinium_polyedra.AAC.1